jgi:uncharacterized membrane protein
MKFDKITNENILLFAIQHYDNPQCEGEGEFLDDMKRFKYLKRLFRRYEESGDLKERLILNHIIVLNNVFGAEAASTLLIFKIEQKFWSELKTFMEFLGMLPENELKDIEINEHIKRVLEKL